MKRTNEIVCTGIELSPDGWKHVYLNFIEKTGAEEKPHRIVFPFEKEVREQDEETGEWKVRKVKCMKSGNFSKAFREEVIAEAMRTFAPNCLQDVLRLTGIAVAFGSTTTLAGISDLGSLLRKARAFVDAYDVLAEKMNQKTMYKKEARAWRLYSSILYQFEHWA